MDDREAVIKHLEFIQGAITRLAQNSFLIKGWSLTILAAAILFISRYTMNPHCIILTFILPVIGFWGLDGYFLWQERVFRGIYNDVRKQDTTDFNMSVETQKEKRGISWLSAMFSKTLIAFYLVEAGFVTAVFLAL